MATGGMTGFQFQKEEGISLFGTMSRPEMGPTHSSTKLVAGVLAPGISRTEREGDHSNPSTPPPTAWHICLIIHGETLYFSLPLLSLSLS
jgi:hypothetical protein